MEPSPPLIRYATSRSASTNSIDSAALHASLSRHVHLCCCCIISEWQIESRSNFSRVSPDHIWSGMCACNIMELNALQNQGSWFVLTPQKYYGLSSAIWTLIFAVGIHLFDVALLIWSIFDKRGATVVVLFIFLLTVISAIEQAVQPTSVGRLLLALPIIRPFQLLFRFEHTDASRIPLMGFLSDGGVCWLSNNMKLL